MRELESFVTRRSYIRPPISLFALYRHAPDVGLQPEPRLTCIDGGVVKLRGDER